MKQSSMIQEVSMHTLSFINLYLFRHTLLKEAESQQTESGVVQKAQRQVKKKKTKTCVIYECLGKS